ncbi:MAG TPA: dihydroorotate dehydrogenase [Actinomycetota bacterium]|nr:dihydroorotate dehydrogenase [Actinomycetota bacterium]
MKPKLEVDLGGGLTLAHPVVAASGCLGTGRDVAGLVDLHRLAAVVTRSLTPAPSKGAPTTRAAETPSGFLSWVGLQNPGVEEFVEVDLPRLSRFGTPVIASIAGSTLDDYVRMASRLHVQPGIVGLEVYLGTPDHERRDDPFYAHLERIREVVGSVSRLSRAPVFVKLPALLPDLVATARACVREGAHGLTLIDAVPGLAVDAGRLRSKLAAPVGGLSGPAIKPIALAAAYRVARALPEVPIMGVGGIATGEDAVEFLLAGASAVQVGTAILVNPSAPVEIARGIQDYLKDKGIASPADLRGRLRVRGDDEPAGRGDGGSSPREGAFGAPLAHPVTEPGESRA